MKTELILLAAGQSKRFGGIKQLTDIHGQTMICHCLSQFRDGGKWLDGIDNGLVVLGANAALISKIIPLGINQKVVTNWQNGMGYTLAQSMQMIAKDTSHVLVALADQVLISFTIIEKMLAESKQSPQQIIAANYAEKLGAPAIFPRQYFSQLGQLSGDQGARKILNQDPQNIISLLIPEGAFDIDTPEDLKFVLR